jgi:L-glyceraldehyde 3-phosphate reductase
MAYEASATRYDDMQYNRCGRSGLKLPAISLGLWHNFGNVDDYKTARKIVRTAFDCGITHFDLANNYGPPPGQAEKVFGKIVKENFTSYRDEMIISSKAGYYMWPGPYGEWGSKKYLVASLDQSLKRMGLDYVDIFYSHRPDPDTPMEETMAALDLIVRQGKALYVGISSYTAGQTKNAAAILKRLGTPCLIHQPRYSMFDRWVENGLMDVLGDEGIGCIAFSPLAQGLLTDKYLKEIPADSRVGRGLSNGAITKEAVSEKVILKVRQLNEIAQQRRQSLAQMAIAWLLKDKRVTSVLVGISAASQLKDNIDCLNNLEFTDDELKKIDKILSA